MIVALLSVLIGFLGVVTGWLARDAQALRERRRHGRVSVYDYDDTRVVTDPIERLRR